MQNRENAAIRKRITFFGFPSHTRTLDSLSYFFITASTSSAVPVKPSAAGAVFTAASVLCLFRKLINQIPFLFHFRRTFPETPCLLFCCMLFTASCCTFVLIWSVRSDLFQQNISLRLRGTELRLRKLQSQDPAHFSCHVPGCRCCRRCLLPHCKYHFHLHHPAR